MKQDWHPDELAQHWTLSPDERELLGNKTRATRLSFAILLKAFQFDGRFPERRADVAGCILAHLASQTDVPPDAYSDGEWSERTQRQQRAQIREHCGFRVFRAEDEPALIAWLSERVSSPNPEAEAFKMAAYGHLRSQRLEPPAVRRQMEAALTALDTGLPANGKVTIVTTRNGKGRIRVTPLEEQPEPANMVALTAALVHRWPMTNLLDILKETELRVCFTEAFRTTGSREVLHPDVFQRRLLLCLYGPGHQCGPQAHAQRRSRGQLR